MFTHRFTQTIVVAGVSYKAGQSVNASEIPAGSLDSLTRLGQLVAISEEEIERSKQPAMVATSKIELASEPAILPPADEPKKPEVGDDPDATPAEITAKKSKKK